MKNIFQVLQEIAESSCWTVHFERTGGASLADMMSPRRKYNMHIYLIADMIIESIRLKLFPMKT
jgi:hypothetical protein